MKRLFVLFTILLLAGCTNSEKKFKEPPILSTFSDRIDYVQGGKRFSGYLSYEEDKNHKRPGILIIHHWVGLDDFTMKEADRFAKSGYVVFAMDMYGKDVNIKSHEEAAKVSGYYRENRDLMRSRIGGAIEVLKANQYVDTDNLAAVGYCFGGDALIDYMLYANNLKAGVSFHGFYTSPLINEELKGDLQINHGQMDSSSTMEQLKTFVAAHPETETYIYEGAEHSFTVPDSPRYNKVAARDSFERAKAFFRRKLDTKGYREFLNYTLTIDAPAKEVFSYLTDTEKNKLWIKGLYDEETLYAEEDPYLDSRFIQRIKSFGMDMEFLGVISSYSEPNYLEMYYSNKNFLIKLDYILKEGDRGTTLTHRAYALDSGVFSNFVNKRILKRQMNRLKRVIEKQ